MANLLLQRGDLMAQQNGQRTSTKSKRSHGCANPPKAQAIQKQHSDDVFAAFKQAMEKHNG